MRKIARTQTFTEWLDSYPQSGTSMCYHSATRSFFQTIYGNTRAPEDLAEDYIKNVKSGRRDYIRDLVTFINAHKDRPPKTLHLYMAGIRQFLLYCCDVDLSTKEKRMLRQRMPKGNRARTREDDLHFDIKNPRLRHLGKLQSEEDVERLLWKEPSTRTLYREIEYTQGLSTPLIIDEDGVVREGNRRLVCLRKLKARIARGETDVPMYKVAKIPCYVFPRRTPEDDIALFQALEHVTGKKEWRPVNQAAHVFDLRNEYGLSFARISEILGRSQSSIRSMEKAYRATLEFHELFPDDTSWMGKYSYFFEAYRHRQTTEWLNIDGNPKRLADWIHSGKISKGSEVRNLQLVIGDVSTNKGKQLTRDQKQADKRLISLNNYSREILNQIMSLKQQGRLTKDALKTIEELQA